MATSPKWRITSGQTTTKLADRARFLFPSICRQKWPHNSPSNQFYTSPPAPPSPGKKQNKYCLWYLFIFVFQCWEILSNFTHFPEFACSMLFVQTGFFSFSCLVNFLSILTLFLYKFRCINQFRLQNIEWHAHDIAENKACCCCTESGSTMSFLSLSLQHYCMSRH